MSYYLVNKKLLQDVIDPYKDNLLDIMPQITIDEIDLAVQTTNIFEDENEGVRENLIRKIAYLVANEKYINIELEFLNDIPYCADVCSLMAGIYRKKEFVPIAMNDGTNLDRLKIDISKDKVDFSPLYYSANVFSWEKVADLSSETWSNKEFILNFIEKNVLTVTSDVYFYPPTELWNDEEFLKQILVINPKFLSIAPKEFLYKQSILNIAKESKAVLIFLTQSIYLSLLSEENNRKYKIELNNLKFKEGSSNEFDIENNVEPSNIQQILLKKYKEEVLTDVSLCKLILEGYEASFYRYISEKIKYNPTILNFLIDHCSQKLSYFSLENNVEKSLFLDEDFLKKYINKVLHKVDRVKDKEYIYSHWINNKEKIMEYAQLTKQEIPKPTNIGNGYKISGSFVEPEDPFLKFFDVLPKEMRQDYDILEVFIKKNPKIYNRLSEVARSNKALLLAYVSQPEWLDVEFKSEKVPLEALLSLNHEELKMAIKKMPDLILKDGMPPNLLLNIEIIECLGHEVLNFNIDESVWKKLCQNEQICMNLIKLNIKCYQKLTIEGRLNHNLALFYIKNHRSTIDDTIENIPKELWGSVDFCLKAIEIKDALTKKLHVNFWNNRDIVSGLARMVDEKKIQSSVFQYAPSRISELIHTYDLTEGGFRKFFDSYMTNVVLSKNLSENSSTKKRNKI